MIDINFVEAFFAVKILLQLDHPIERSEQQHPSRHIQVFGLAERAAHGFHAQVKPFRLPTPAESQDRQSVPVPLVDAAGTPWRVLGNTVGSDRPCPARYAQCGAAAGRADRASPAAHTTRRIVLSLRVIHTPICRSP